VFVNNQHGIQRRGQDFDLKRYTVKKLSDEFPRENLWTKLGVNNLLKKLRDTGTLDRRPGSGRPRSARILKKTLRQLSQEDKPQTHKTIREISRETAFHWCTQNAICLHFAFSPISAEYLQKI